MTEFTQGILIGLIPALIVSVITAYLTVRLSMRQFYSQRWWEKKAEAYSKIIEHLSELQNYYELWRDAFTFDKMVTDKAAKRLGEDYRIAKDSLNKVAFAGAYIISDDTANALSELFGKLRQLELVDQQSMTVQEETEEGYNIVKTCITNVRKFAKTDLLIK